MKSCKLLHLSRYRTAIWKCLWKVSSILVYVYKWLDFLYLCLWYFWPMHFSGTCRLCCRLQGTSPNVFTQRFRMTNIDQTIPTSVQDDMVQRFLDNQGLHNAMTAASKNLKLSPLVDMKWDVHSLNFVEHGKFLEDGLVVSLVKPQRRDRAWNGEQKKGNITLVKIL